MLFWYEKACQEAGMEEEKIRELRRGFDADYKRLKREKRAKRQSGYTFCLLSEIEMEDSNGKTGEWVDQDVNIEEEAINNYELGQLRKVLGEMTDDDREFILASFKGEHGSEQRLMDRLGLSRDQIRYRREKLVAVIKERMGY